MNGSKLKFFVDVGVGKNIEEYLRDQGYDTKAVREMDPRMKDEEIIRTAFYENRMIITMDKDFGELVHHSSMNHSGILLLRLEDATGDEKLKFMDYIMNNFSSQTDQAAAVVPPPNVSSNSEPARIFPLQFPACRLNGRYPRPDICMPKLRMVICR